MIIDIHTHTFPPALAPRALALLSQSARACFYADGTTQALRRSMQQAGIDVSVVQPVVTAARQTESINRTACQLCQTFAGKNRPVEFWGHSPRYAPPPDCFAYFKGKRSAGH